MMLMPSRRHRPEDLELWHKLEIVDRLNYGLRHVEDKANRAIRLLGDAITRRAGKCYVAVSWGKDSLVVAHLFWRLIQAKHPYASLVPVYRIRMDGIETPGTDEVEQEFLNHCPLNCYQRIEVPHDPNCERLEDQREPALERGIAEAQRLVGTRFYINGLRRDESVSRRLQLSKGLVRTHSCSPIGQWHEEDIFAYLAHHELPVHPNYAMTAGGFWPREGLRVCMLGNWKGRQYGRLLWEEWYYRDVLDAMRTINPKMVP